MTPQQRYRSSRRGFVVSLLKNARRHADENGRVFALYTPGPGRRPTASLTEAVDRLLAMAPTHCPYLGTELVYSADAARRGKRPSVASINRIDPARGYTWDNIEWLSWRANELLRNATDCELLLISRRARLRTRNTVLAKMGMAPAVNEAA